MTKIGFFWCYVVLAWLFICPAQAANTAAPSVPFAPRSGTPIDISADELEILQAENKAIFTGHVVAIQGDVRLTSEKMTVFYKEKSADEGKAKSKNAASQNSIRRIEVEQNVFLATPVETATGAAGVYDVENETITLHNNVVLTKDKNTLKGDHLVYNFKTGKSRLTSGNGSTQQGSGGKTRVRALFVPENNDTVQEDTQPNEKK